MKPMAIARIVVLLAAPAAQAGSRILAGPMFVATGQSFLAGVANVGTKPVTNLTVQCRNSAGTLVVSANATQLNPDTAFNPGNSGPNTIFCSWTSDQGAKSLRATLQNATTGAILRAE